ncbi:MAG: flagellar motor stator protein MotA [Nitrospirae bacterium]|nr:flagellar motor stator protein MotA [Nitrospirota bacterium]
MITVFGLLIVLVAVLISYRMEHGNILFLAQFPEIILICGAALGGFIAASPRRVRRSVFVGMREILVGKQYSKADYLECLCLLGEVFYVAHKNGYIALEQDLSVPEESSIFIKYPGILKRRYVLLFIIDTFKTLEASNISPSDMEQLLYMELEMRHECSVVPARSVGSVADSLPGLGIVAAVLGVIITMGKMNEKPDVIGRSIAVALIGTLLGVLLSYGFVGPLSRHLEHMADEEKEFLNTVKVAIIAFVSGMLPRVAIEFGRRLIPEDMRPSFEELELAFDTVKKSSTR